MNTKISDAAVEAARRALYFATSPEATEADYIKDSLDEQEDAEEVTLWLRAAITAALPHLHPQPAELAEQHGDALVASLVQVMNAEYDGLGRLPADVLGVLNMAAEALAATGKQQVGEVQRDALADAARRVLSDVDSGDHHGEISESTYAALESALAARQPGELIAQKVGDYRVTVAEDTITVSHGRDIVFAYSAGDAEPIMTASARIQQLRAQPVGAAFGWWLVDENGIGRLSRTPPKDTIEIYRDTPGYSAIPLYTAPPAQGIDLGQFRDRIKAAIDRIVNHQCLMRIPVDNTDPDIVLADILRLIEGQRDAAPGPRISQGTHDPSGVGNG